MPRRSTGSSESPAPRRQSARIAAAVASKPTTPSPAKKTPKRASKRVSKGALASQDDSKLNGNEVISVDISDSEELAEKKQKLDDQNESKESVTEVLSEPVQNDSKEGPMTVDSHQDTKEATDAGFEVVSRSEVPNAESEEVKSAISAQGEDGQLLVNYVQVTNEDVPQASDVKEDVAAPKETIVDATTTAPATNGVETVGESAAKGDEPTDSAVKATDNEVAEKSAADAHQNTTGSQLPAASSADETPVSQ